MQRKGTSSSEPNNPQDINLTTEEQQKTQSTIKLHVSVDLTSPDNCGTMTPTTSGNATARGSTGEAGNSILFGNVHVKHLNIGRLAGLVVKSLPLGQEVTGSIPARVWHFVMSIILPLPTHKLFQLM
jgi:hypothetical protein